MILTFRFDLPCGFNVCFVFRFLFFPVWYWRIEQLILGPKYFWINLLFFKKPKIFGLWFWTLFKTKYGRTIIIFKVRNYKIIPKFLSKIGWDRSIFRFSPKCQTEEISQKLRNNEVMTKSITKFKVIFSQKVNRNGQKLAVSINFHQIF